MLGSNKGCIEFFEDSVTPGCGSSKDLPGEGPTYLVPLLCTYLVHGRDKCFDELSLGVRG